MIVHEVLGVMVAEQLDVVALTVVKLHGEPVNEPLAEPVLLKATVPPGVDAVPDAVSLTNAVQLTDCPMTALAGVQVTVVDVVRRLTVTVLLVPVLPVWAVSVPATV